MESGRSPRLKGNPADVRRGRVIRCVRARRATYPRGQRAWGRRRHNNRWAEYSGVAPLRRGEGRTVTPAAERPCFLARSLSAVGSRQNCVSVLYHAVPREETETVDYDQDGRSRVAVSFRMNGVESTSADV